MKKIVLGCGIVVLLLAIVGGAGMYYFVYRPAKAFVSSMAQLGEVVDLDKQVSNRQAFAAPDDGTLTAAHVQRFEALNAQRFSIEEYTWVKHRFYEAAGVALTGVDFREIASQMQEGKFDAIQPRAKGGDAPVATDTPGVGIPDANRALVAPFKDKLQNWMVYGAFGL